MTTSEFILQHRLSNPRDLALQARRYPDVDMPYALNQIQGWQTARQKLPSWASCDGVVYPPHLNMEQCSSEPTARYKQEVALRWLNKLGLGQGGATTSMADLTGGFGVDFSFTSRCFTSATYVERNAALCDVVSGNLPRLGISNANVVCAEAEDYLATMPQQTMLFLDPARRDEHGAKTVLMADCTPDVCRLLPQLMSKARFVMLKLSPMLDWHKAIADLKGTVDEVHIVSVGGECKELLLVLAGKVSVSSVDSGSLENGVRVYCVDIMPKAEADGEYKRSEFCYIIGGAADNPPTLNPQPSTLNSQLSTPNSPKPFIVLIWTPADSLCLRSPMRLTSSCNASLHQGRLRSATRLCSTASRRCCVALQAPSGSAYRMTAGRAEYRCPSLPTSWTGHVSVSTSTTARQPLPIIA